MSEITGSETAKPPVVDSEAWQEARKVILTREKAHTREADALAAARRSLPMTEVPNLILTGPNGPISLLDVFEGRDELIVYKHMWSHGEPFEFQCAGCTISISGMSDTAYLNRRGITFAVFAEGTWDEVGPFVDFMGYSFPWYSSFGIDHWAIGQKYGEIAFFLRDGDRIFLTNLVQDRGVETMVPTFQLLNMSAFGRKEQWEQVPDGWPNDKPKMWYWVQDHRPTRQWTRPDATPVEAGWGDWMLEEGS